MFAKRQEDSLKSFLSTTKCFRLFLAELVEDKRLLEDDEEGINELEDTMSAFKENGLLTEDQFRDFGLLFYASILLGGEIDKGDEIYKPFKYLPLFCGSFVVLCQALADQQWRVERES